MKSLETFISDFSPESFTDFEKVEPKVAEGRFLNHSTVFDFNYHKSYLKIK